MGVDFHRADNMAELANRFRQQRAAFVIVIDDQRTQGLDR
jgi:hypothetical protein